jgi:hypothetical protein
MPKENWVHNLKWAPILFCYSVEASLVEAKDIVSNSSKKKI